MDKKEQDKAFEAVRGIAFDDIERTLLGAEAEKPSENAPGSYERLMRGFSQLEARGKTL